MLKLFVCRQVNGKTVFWKCWKLSPKSFILHNLKLVCQDDFSGLVSSFFKLPHNVLGIAEGGEIEALSFDFGPRRARTNFFELNLKIKNEFYSFLAEIEAQTLNFAL